MLRKWTTLALAVAVVAGVASGFSMADDKSKLHELMEAVGKEGKVINSATSSKVKFAKADKKEIVKSVDEMISLGKKSRDMKDAAEKQKKPMEDWTKAVDDFIKKSEDFKVVMAKPGLTYDQAKKAYATVKASCSSCHHDFKGEDD